MTQHCFCCLAKTKALSDFVVARKPSLAEHLKLNRGGGQRGPSNRSPFVHSPVHTDLILRYPRKVEEYVTFNSPCRQQAALKHF